MMWVGKADLEGRDRRIANLEKEAPPNTSSDYIVDRRIGT